MDVVVLAGKGMQGRIGVGDQARQTLARTGVNVIGESQGVQERCISYVIDQADGHNAVNALYDEFIRPHHQEEITS